MNCSSEKRFNLEGARSFYNPPRTNFTELTEPSRYLLFWFFYCQLKFFIYGKLPYSQPEFIHWWLGSATVHFRWSLSQVITVSFGMASYTGMSIPTESFSSSATHLFATFALSWKAYIYTHPHPSSVNLIQLILTNQFSSPIVIASLHNI